MEQNIRLVRDNGRGIFAMKPLGGGHLIASSAEAMGYRNDQISFEVKEGTPQIKIRQ